MSEFLTPQDVTKIYKIPNRTLQTMRRGETGPEFIRVTHKAVLYRREDIERFLESRKNIGGFLYRRKKTA